MDLATKAELAGAHPRVGGENRRDGEGTPLSEGSSPRGRGKLRRRPAQPHVFRLIPAWAGKTSPGRNSVASDGAHPRVGGENSTGEYFGATSMGSSPRGRGKPPCAHRSRRSVGLIPAWAGKTPAGTRSARASKAHPRVGGENVGTLRGGAAAAGSSPRGRGKPHDWRVLHGGRAAHPRVGGENPTVEAAVSAYAGSSPRGRGKP